MVIGLKAYGVKCNGFIVEGLYCFENAVFGSYDETLA